MNQMTTLPTTESMQPNSSNEKLRRKPVSHWLKVAGLGMGLIVAFAGCETPNATLPAQSAGSEPEAQTLREGDVLKIAFPGAPNLDTTQQVRRDGRISLAIIGEIVVTGMTPSELEKDLAKRYSTQLLSSEVNVTVVSSSYSVFVTGAVLRPGKLQPDHPMTVLEAIMEAGGFDSTKADMKAVVVIRQEKGGTKNYTVNMKAIIDGTSNESFYLKPSDIVYVPEKFSWF
jgi:polysaccharide biosynthesis/export protein